MFVQGNEDRLTQLLDKLIENAVEHTYPGGGIRVTVRVESGMGSLVVENTETRFRTTSSAFSMPLSRSRRKVRPGRTSA